LHVFIVVSLIISTKSISRRKEKEQRSSTGVAIVFTVPESSDHRLCAEAAVPLSSSISITREGEKENTENGTEEEKKKRESAGKTKKRRETINQQGLPFGLCFRFLHIKSAEQGRRKCRKSVERERNEDCRGETQKKNANRE
jgi:hypothetical protein